MNCDISSGLLTIHHLCSIWLLLKVAHDWISLSVAVCLLIVWITKKIMQVWVYFETIFFIYTNKSDFILQIKLRNSIILEFANCPDCQFANLILSHHLPIHRIKMCQWKYVITSVCRIFWVNNWIKLVYILYECEKNTPIIFLLELYLKNNYVLMLLIYHNEASQSNNWMLSNVMAPLIMPIVCRLWLSQ